MPKSLALGMAVRQLTRSSRLTQILNGFGHCASHSAILTYETDLANLAIKSDCCVPKDAEKSKFTCLVYDNDDFTKESKNQTNVLGGILIQQEVPSTSVPDVALPQVQKKGGRRFQAPGDAIVPYYVGKKTDTQFFRFHNVEANDPLLKDHVKRLDFEYFLMKFFHNQSGHQLLPGWTCFNILLRQSAIPPISRIRYLPIIDGSPSEYSTLLF